MPARMHSHPPARMHAHKCMIVQVLLGETDSRTCGDAWATWGVVPKMGCARCDYEPDGCQRYVCGTVSSDKELQYVQSVTSYSVAVTYCILQHKQQQHAVCSDSAWVFLAAFTKFLSLFANSPVPNGKQSCLADTPEYIFIFTFSLLLPFNDRV